MTDERIRRNRERMEVMRKNDEQINDLLVSMGLPVEETFEEQLNRLGDREIYLGDDAVPEVSEGDQLMASMNYSDISVEDRYRRNREYAKKSTENDIQMNEILTGMGIPPNETFEQRLKRTGEWDSFIGAGCLPEDNV